jgi:hypothetical protein
MTGTEDDMRAEWSIAQEAVRSRKKIDKSGTGLRDDPESRIRSGSKGEALGKGVQNGDAVASKRRRFLRKIW